MIDYVDKLECLKCGHTWVDNGYRAFIGLTGVKRAAWCRQCGSVEVDSIGTVRAPCKVVTPLDVDLGGDDRPKVQGHMR